MHPLLALIANATESELAKYIEYLKVENQVLQARLPKKIDTTEAERAVLLRAGKPLGAKIKGLITIVTPRTFQRWGKAEREGYSHNREVETKTKGDNQQLDEILLYYHSSRTQLSVDCNSPTPREMESPSLGKVVSIPQVGSLNDRYTRAA